MKLFYKPGACSLASHIILHELNLPFELERVDTEKGLTQSGINYRTINPKGYVPALALASGEVLSEGAAILQYLADHHPGNTLAPVTGTLARTRIHEHLNYISSELHKAFTPLFTTNSTEAEQHAAHENVAKKIAYINTFFDDGRDYLLGDEFSIADAYLFAVVNWANFVDVKLTQWPAISDFLERVASRPSTQAAMRAEELI